MSADNAGKNWLRRSGIMTLKEIIQFVRDPVLMFHPGVCLHPEHIHRGNLGFAADRAYADCLY